jgi:prepilin-type N-terminal cleavage/methylation domain-containing protein
MHCNEKAFTLIELLVVVLIIGILAAIALPQYQNSVEKTRMAHALTLSKAIAEAEERYFLANGDYSYNINALDINIPGTATNYYGDAIATKYYICRGTSKNKGAHTDILGLCNRIPSETIYYIGYTKNRSRCYSYSNKGEKFCKLMFPNKESDRFFYK